MGVYIPVSYAIGGDYIPSSVFKQLQGPLFIFFKKSGI